MPTHYTVTLCRAQLAPGWVTDNGGGVRFPQILDLFQSSKIWVPSGCLRETSIFKIIMIDDIRDFVVKARINMVGLLDVINFIS